MKPLKILHFSDIHATLGVKNIKYSDLSIKRLIGGMNYSFRRKKNFIDVKKKIEALIEFKKEHNIDIVINTGDYTVFGLKDELKFAKKLLEPLMTPTNRYITIAGNHDIYVDTEESYKNFFEEYGSLLQSDMPQYGTYPIVRLIRDNCAIIMLNSAKSNLLPWKSSGKIPQQELEALEKILEDKILKNRFIFIGLHYAPRLANGENDTKRHGLENVDEFLNICKKIEFGAILCGHIHRGYRISIEDLNSEIFCAGSLTMQGCEGFWVYELDGNRFNASFGYWGENRFELKS